MNTSKSKPIVIVLMPLVVVILVWGSSAMAIYINPAPAIDPLPNSTHPAVGIVGDDSGPGGTFLPFCSGSLIDSNIQLALQPAVSFVLTAGHCVENDGAPPLDLIGNDSGRFRVGGPGGPFHNSDRVRRHPDYALPVNAVVNDDVSLMRLSGQVGNVAPLRLRRIAAAAGDEFTAVGFGSTGYAGGTTNTGFPTKREAAFSVGTVNAAGPGNSNDYSFANGAAPLRHLCQGDSGGPSLFAGLIQGVHSYVTNPGAVPGFSPCDGNNTSNVDANVSQPFLSNWIDSYTQKAIFWDNLRIDGVVKDRFEAGAGTTGTDCAGSAAGTGYDRGLTGCADGWVYDQNQPNIPGANNMPPLDNAGWRFINAIGKDNLGNAELYCAAGANGACASVLEGGVSSQGEIMRFDASSVIKKTFDVSTAGTLVSIGISERWNSLGLGSAMGVQFGNGAINWGTFATSTQANLDLWISETRLLPRGGETMMTVYLLNTPEPASLGLIAIGFLAIRPRDRPRKPARR